MPPPPPPLRGCRPAASQESPPGAASDFAGGTTTAPDPCRGRFRADAGGKPGEVATIPATRRRVAQVAEATGAFLAPATCRRCAASGGQGLACCRDLWLTVALPER